VRLLFALLVVSGPTFRGCSSSGDDLPPGGSPLPTADGGACLRDTDCAPDMCMDYRCLAGACVAVAPLLDRDGDGIAPSPCGGDCDDGNPLVSPRALERCDGLDNDCDGTPDDGAPRDDRALELTGIGDPTSIIVGWGDRFLVTQATPSALFGYVVALDGSVSPGPLEIMRLLGGTSFAEVSAAVAADGRVMFVVRTDFGFVRYIVLEPTTDGARYLEGPTEVALPTPAYELEVIAYRDGFAIAYDLMATDGPIRTFSVDPATEPVARVPLRATLPSASFGFATDGTLLAVSDDADTVVFFDAAGVEVIRHVLPRGPLPARPLAALAGAVVVVVPDEFDYNLAMLDATVGLGTTFPAPFGSASNALEISSAGDLVIVGRVSRGSTGFATVQAVRSDLSTLEGPAVNLGSFDGVSPLSFASNARGAVAVLGPPRSVAMLLACGS
jgi:hypothetical protein